MEGNNKKTRRDVLKSSVGIIGGVAAASVLGLNVSSAQAATASSNLTIGNRIPSKWFAFKSAGTSDQGFGTNPFETFSYDTALRNSLIEDYNVIPYTSVIPLESYGNIINYDEFFNLNIDNTVTRDEVQTPCHPGSVLEVIFSAQGMEIPEGEKGYICTGLAIIWAAEPETPNILRNGFAAEYVNFWNQDDIITTQPVNVNSAAGACELALKQATAHELEIRGLVEYVDPNGGSGGFNISINSRVFDNSDNSKPYAYSLTGIGVYEYLYPQLTSS